MFCNLICYNGCRHTINVNSVVEAAMVLGPKNESYYSFLPRESYAKRGICRRRVTVCVCVCVCLSHSGIVSKLLNIESRK